MPQRPSQPHWIADDFVQEIRGNLCHSIPMFDLIEIFRRRTPQYMHAAVGAAVFDQREFHAGTCSDQHQRPVRQSGQMRITGSSTRTIALRCSCSIRLSAPGFARQSNMDFRITPRHAVPEPWRTPISRRSRVRSSSTVRRIARWFARRRTQPHAPGVATDIAAFDDLTRQAAHRAVLSQHDNAIPQQDAVFQRSLAQV